MEQNEMCFERLKASHGIILTEKANGEKLHSEEECSTVANGPTQDTSWIPFTLLL